MYIFLAHCKRLPEIIHFAEDFFVFNVAAGVSAQGSPADRASQTADMPDQIIHLQFNAKYLLTVTDRVKHSTAPTKHTKCPETAN